MSHDSVAKIQQITIDNKSILWYNSHIHSNKAIAMKLYIWTQDYENYGDETAPFWKAKGSEDYFVPVTSTQLIEGVIESVRGRIEVNSDFFRSYIAGWQLVEDDYRTEFEKSQLEYDGKIVYPTIVLQG